jgi:hypothetical protein
MRQLEDDVQNLSEMVHRLAHKSEAAHKLAQSAVQPHIEERFSQSVKGHREKLAADLETLKGVQRTEHVKAMKPHQDEVAQLKKLVQALRRQVNTLEATLETMQPKSDVMAKGFIGGFPYPKTQGQAIAQKEVEVRETAERATLERDRDKFWDETNRKLDTTIRQRADAAIEDPKAFGIVDSLLQNGKRKQAELIVKAYEARGVPQ